LIVVWFIGLTTEEQAKAKDILKVLFDRLKFFIKPAESVNNK